MTDAGALEVTQTIEHLDESWPCAGGTETCPIPATWVVLWACSNCSDMVCPGHKIIAQANIERLMERGDVLMCSRCRIEQDPTQIKFVPL